MPQYLVRSIDDAAARFSDEQRRQFIAGRLSFDSTTHSMGGGGAMMPGGAGGVAPMMMMSSSRTHWTAFQGTQKITEEKFFELVGYAEMATAARKLTESASNQLIGGVISGLFALGFSILSIMSLWTGASADTVDTASAYSPFIVTGIVSILVMVFVAMIFGYITKTNSNTTPLNVVAPMADEYNLSLARNILAAT